MSKTHIFVFFSHSLFFIRIYYNILGSKSEKTEVRKKNYLIQKVKIEIL